MLQLQPAAHHQAVVQAAHQVAAVLLAALPVVLPVVVEETDPLTEHTQ